MDEGFFKDEERQKAFRNLISVEGGVHRPERAIYLDSIEPALTAFVNERGDGRLLQPMYRLKEVFANYNSKDVSKVRYQYHGGDMGTFGYFFSFMDTLVYITLDGARTRLASVSPWNRAHFFCDILGTETECALFLEWIRGNAFWLGEAMAALPHPAEEP